MLSVFAHAAIHETAVTTDLREGSSDRNVAILAADHDCNFAIVIQCFRLSWAIDRLAMRHKNIERALDDHRFLWLIGFDSC